jgi:hypothetical protein
MNSVLAAGPSATTLNMPFGLFFDSMAGNLLSVFLDLLIIFLTKKTKIFRSYVADTNSNRVVVFPTANSLEFCPENANCSCSNSRCTVSSSLVVGPGSTLNVFSASLLSVTGSLTSFAGSRIYIDISAPIPVVSAVISAEGNVTLDGILSIVVGCVAPTNVTIFQASSILGRFASVSAASTNPCMVVASSVTYSSSSVSVILQTSQNDSCFGGNGLSGGAIAGIIIGVIVAGCLLGLSVVFIMRYRTATRDARAKELIRKKESDHALRNTYL